MKALLKILVGLVVLIIIAALAAPYFISADSFKGQIIAKVQEATGRTLTIDGKLKLTFFPSVGVSAENVTISNPPGFDDKTPLATLKALKVSVATMPLLSKHVEVKSFVLDEPNINLHVNKAGVKNWEFVTQNAKQEVKESKDQPAPKAGSGLPAGLVLSGAEIKDGSLKYTDDNAKTSTVVSKLNTSVDMKSLDSPAKFAGSAEWNGKVSKVTADVSSIAAIMNHESADVAFTAKGDLFDVEARGKVVKDVFTGKAAIKSASLKELALWANPGSKPLPTPAKLAFDFGGDVACNAGGCSIAGASITLDQLKATGNAKVATGGAKPSVDLDLATGILDINPFLPPEPKAHSSLLISDAFADSGHWTDAVIDLSALNGANVNATIKSEGIVFRKITIGKTPVSVKLANGRLNLAIADAALYKGTGSITIVADAAGTYAMGANFKGVQAEPLLTDADITDKFAGAADIKLDLTSHGRSQREIISVLGGTGAVKISDGILKGVDLGNMMRNVATSFKVNANSAEKTVFSDMSGTFAIAQGVVTNNDLSLKTSGAQIAGKGTVNLPAYTINYRLTPQMVSNSKDVTTGKVTQKEGLAVPVLITGSLDAPSYQPDAASLIQDAINDPSKLKDQLKNSKGALKEQLKDPKAALKNLKNSFGGLR